MVVYLLHMIGTLAVGFYLLLPLVVKSMKKLSAPAQEGSMSVISILNRLAQFALIVQLLTGGYMLTGGGDRYSVAWMVVVILLLLIMGGFSGMMGKPLRLAMEGVRSGADISSSLRKISTFSIGMAVALLVMVYFMVNSSII